MALWKVLDGNKAFLAFHSRLVDLCCSFFYSILPTIQELAPQCRDWKRRNRSHSHSVWHSFNVTGDKWAWSKATLRRTAQQNFNVSVRLLIPRHSHVSYTPFCRGCMWPWKRKSPLMPRNLRNTVSKPSHYQTPFFVCLFTPYGAFGASRVKERFDSLYIPNSFDLLIEI